MPNPTSEIACTAAVDLPDVRCAAAEHPHRGAHHRTGNLSDGTRWTVFWWTADQPDADQQLDAALPATVAQPITGEDPVPVPQRMPARLRRSDYYSRTPVHA